MYFHSQMLADYETVADFGSRMLRELDQPTKAPSKVELGAAHTLP